MNSEEWLKSNYKLLFQIDTGTTSEVYSAIHIQSNLIVAIKIVNLDYIQDEKSDSGDVNESVADKADTQQLVHHYVDNEIRMLKNVDHPNIIKLFDVKEFKDEGILFMVMEFATNGNLTTYLVDGKKSVDEKVLYKFFKQICDAIFYMHNVIRVVHRDIKAENVLIDDDNNVKLADFGLSKKIENDSLLSTQCGSINYVSPEIIKGEGYSEKTDIWSLGVLLYLMAVGSFPFEDDNAGKLFQKILSDPVKFPASNSSFQNSIEAKRPNLLLPTSNIGNNKLHPIMNDCKIDSNLKDLIWKMLEKDQDKRISIVDVLNHPWMKARSVQNSSTFLPSINFSDKQIIERYMKNDLIEMGVSPEEFEKLKNENAEFIVTLRLIKWKAIKKIQAERKAHLMAMNCRRFSNNTKKIPCMPGTLSIPKVMNMRRLSLQKT